MPFPLTSPTPWARPGTTAETLDRCIATASFTPNSGTAYAVKLPVQVAAFNNASIFVGGTAKLGGSHGWYAILDPSGNVVAVTPDQTDAATTWGTINSEQALPFAPGYLSYLSSVRNYYFVFCIVATTMPVILGAPNVPAAFGIAAPSLVGTAGSGLTVPPVLGSNITITASAVVQPYAYTT